MKIITEKKAIVGVVKTDWQKYNLLDLSKKDMTIGNYIGSVRFHILDDEGFDNYVFIHGPYTVIPSMLPEFKDVKTVLTDEEAQDLDKQELFSDEINQSPTN